MFKKKPDRKEQDAIAFFQKDIIAAEAARIEAIEHGDYVHAAWLVGEIEKMHTQILSNERTAREKRNGLFLNHFGDF